MAIGGDTGALLEADEPQEQANQERAAHNTSLCPSWRMGSPRVLSQSTSRLRLWEQAQRQTEGNTSTSTEL